jgi:ABC-2 type transport system ATP-binding protein
VKGVNELLKKHFIIKRVSPTRGLAQALIHNPDVLILDEPTSGLDPNQILEIRKLIKDISHNKTVLFSSHIMQEVQALCNRVVVINRGEIVANDELVNLMHQQKGVVIVVEFERPVDKESFAKIRGTKSVEETGSNTYRLTADEGIDLRPEIFRYAADNNLSLVGLRQEETSLENIFRELTITPAK